MMTLHSISLDNILKVATISYLIKLSYSIVLAWPASSLVTYIKKRTGIDIYDLPKNFTPFKNFYSKQESQT